MNVAEITCACTMGTASGYVRKRTSLFIPNDVLDKTFENNIAGNFD